MRRLALQGLLSAPPDYGYAEADYGDAEPTMGADALAQEGFGAESSGGIAEGANRNDETDLLKGQDGKKGEESEGHEGDAQPHPGQARGLDQKTEERARTKIMDLADAFHGAADAQLAAGTGHHDEKKEDGFEQVIRLP